MSTSRNLTSYISQWIANHADNLTYKPIQDITHRILGRHSTTDEYSHHLYWTGSGVELAYIGTQLWIVIETDYTTFEPWISIDIDGYQTTRTALHRGINSICMLRGYGRTSISNPTHIRLIKETQFMHEDPTQTFIIRGVLCDSDNAQFTTPRSRDLHIEFIGDSITSGEGVEGMASCTTYCSQIFGSFRGYPRLVSDELNASFSVISQAGWGITCNCENDPNYTIPLAYPYICKPAQGQENTSAKCGDTIQNHAFFDVNETTHKTADVVVINLGTNDATAFYAPAWHDNITSKSYALRFDDSGQPSDHSIDAITQETINFVTMVRAHHPQALIIWGYGMLGNLLNDVLRNAINDYKSIYHDNHVVYVPLPPCAEDEYGACRHPGPLNHKNAARRLIEIIDMHAGEQALNSSHTAIGSIGL